MNLVAVEDSEKRFAPLDIAFVESGGDNLAASFCQELVDASIYVIDVAGGDKAPRKGGSGVTRSELLIINKTDLAPLVGADLSVMQRDAGALRGEAPTLFASVLHGDGLGAVVEWVREAAEHRTQVPANPHARGDHHHGHPHEHQEVRPARGAAAAAGAGVERTVIAERYARAPSGSVRANYPDGSGVPEVQITYPSGGILGGDRLETEVIVEPSAAATVLTQAANKAYRGTEAAQSAT